MSSQYFEKVHNICRTLLGFRKLWDIKKYNTGVRMNRKCLVAELLNFMSYPDTWYIMVWSIPDLWAEGSISYKTGENIWVKMIRMGNMHFSCHFVSVFIVTWSQNERSESWEKNIQLTTTGTRFLYFFCQFLIMKKTWKNVH